MIDSIAAVATFDNPDWQSVAVDSQGNAYVAGFISQNVFKVTPAGVVSVVLDTNGDGLGNTLLGPNGISVDADDNLYVGGFHTSNVFRVTPGGAITEIIDSTGDGLGNTLSQPLGTATDSAGNVYVAGYGSHRVFRITPGGVVSLVMDQTGDGTNALLGPTSVRIDSQDNLYVIGTQSDNAFKRTPAGVITRILDSTGDGIGAGFGFGIDAAVDAQDNVYFAGYQTHNVLKVTPAGVVTEILNSSGDGMGNTMAGCAGVTVAPDGTVYATAGASDKVFRIAPGGAIDAIVTASTPVGSAPAFDQPFSVAADSLGNVFISERGGDRLFKFDPDTCGNGSVELDETCDPSAADNGCCTSTCDGVEAAATACTDDGESCTDDVCDGSSVSCTHPAISGSCDDGDSCTSDDTCTDGDCGGTPVVCDDANLCTADSCQDGVGCVYDDAPLDPGSCLLALKSAISIKGSDNPDKAKVSWKFLKGEAFDQADLGNPTVDTAYALCIWDEDASTPTLATAIDIAPGAAWTDNAPKGAQYKDKEGTSDGVTGVKLKPGAAGKTLAILKGKGANIPLPTPVSAEAVMTQDPSVIVQLRGDAGLCLHTEFAPEHTKKNDGVSFQAKR